jgi:hypothetical protein
MSIRDRFSMTYPTASAALLQEVASVSSLELF